MKCSSEIFLLQSCVEAAKQFGLLYPVAGDGGVRFAGTLSQLLLGVRQHRLAFSSLPQGQGPLRCGLGGFIR